MGIKNLMQLLMDKAPESISNITMESLSGRILACDASIVFISLTHIIGNLLILDKYAIYNQRSGDQIIHRWFRQSYSVYLTLCLLFVGT